MILVYFIDTNTFEFWLFIKKHKEQIHARVKISMLIKKTEVFFKLTPDLVLKSSCFSGFQKTINLISVLLCEV